MGMISSFSYEIHFLNHFRVLFYFTTGNFKVDIAEVNLNAIVLSGDYKEEYRAYLKRTKGEDRRMINLISNNHEDCISCKEQLQSAQNMTWLTMIYSTALKYPSSIEQFRYFINVYFKMSDKEVPGFMLKRVLNSILISQHFIRADISE